MRHNRPLATLPSSEIFIRQLISHQLLGYCFDNCCYSTFYLFWPWKCVADLWKRQRLRSKSHAEVCFSATFLTVPGWAHLRCVSKWTGMTLKGYFVFPLPSQNQQKGCLRWGSIWRSGLLEPGAWFVEFTFICCSHLIYLASRESIARFDWLFDCSRVTKDRAGEKVTRRIVKTLGSDCYCSSHLISVAVCREKLGTFLLQKPHSYGSS